MNKIELIQTAINKIRNQEIDNQSRISRMPYMTEDPMSEKRFTVDERDIPNFTDGSGVEEGSVREIKMGKEEQEHKVDGTPCWCNPKIVKVKPLKRKKKEIDFIKAVQMGSLGNMEEMWDWICVQVGLDEDGKDIQEVIKAFIELKLLEQTLNRKMRGYGFTDVHENKIDAIIAKLRAADKLCEVAKSIRPFLTKYPKTLEDFNEAIADCGGEG